jgi:hypothetical protein
VGPWLQGGLAGADTAGGLKMITLITRHTIERLGNVDALLLSDLGVLGRRRCSNSGVLAQHEVRLPSLGGRLAAPLAGSLAGVLG